MSPRKKSDFAPHKSTSEAQACAYPGCTQPGVYKAPVSRDALDNYEWYCLDHIRERNKEWDYFAGLTPEQIEAFMRDATHGHRPTWTRESHLRAGHYDKLQDALHAFITQGRPLPRRDLAAPPRLRQQLALLDIEYPYTAQALKKRYRILVKQYHPDVNKGDKQMEDRFKQITAAYQKLLAHLEEDAPDMRK